MVEHACEWTACFRGRLAEAGIDGAILTDEASIAWLGGRTGDSVVVTKDGCDCLTDYPRHILLAGV